MDKFPQCPMCQEDYTYEDNGLFICPMCNHEWTQESNETSEKVFKDVNGNILVDGDTVIIVKDLNVKGSSNNLKQGTKVKNIRLVDGDHDIECRIEGFGAMQLKTSVVKKG